MTEIVTTTVDLHLFRRNGLHTLYMLLQGESAGGALGHWQIPEVRIADGETPMDSCLRFVRNELGMEPVNLWVHDAVHSFYDPRMNVIECRPIITIEAAGDKAKMPVGFSQRRWITFDQALELLRRPGHREGVCLTQENIVLSRDRGEPFRYKQI